MIRLVALPLEGTGDVLVWKTWSYGALHQGVARLYGVGGQPTERGLVRWGERVTTVDYPPVALYELAVAGAAYRAFSPSFSNGRALNAAMKMPGLLAESGLCWLLYVFVRRLYGIGPGRWAATAYWANPAMVLAGPVLGYLDPLMALPAIAAIAAAAAAMPVAAGSLIALACLTKLQAVFLVPIVALALWNAGRPAGAVRLITALVAACGVAAMVLSPYLLIGASRNVVQGVSSLLRHDMLSADAANVWWLITYVMRASYAAGELGTWVAWTMTLRILGISTIVKLGYPNPRPVATLLVAASALWTLWQARRSTDAAVMCGAAALIVHAYFLFAVAVHENHLYLAVPLLAAAGAARPRLRPILAGVSIVFALNLYLFFGLGRGMPAPPRHLTVVDSTVIVALVNCALFAWHARVFASECAPPAVVAGASAG